MQGAGWLDLDRRNDSVNGSTNDQSLGKPSGVGYPGSDQDPPICGTPVVTHVAPRNLSGSTEAHRRSRNPQKTTTLNFVVAFGVTEKRYYSSSANHMQRTWPFPYACAEKRFVRRIWTGMITQASLVVDQSELAPELAEASKDDMPGSEARRA